VSDEHADALRKQWLAEQSTSAPVTEETALVEQWRQELLPQARSHVREIQEFFGNGRVPRLRRQPGQPSSRRSARSQRYQQEAEDLYLGPYLTLVGERGFEAGLNEEQVREIAEQWRAVTRNIAEAHAWWRAGISPLDQRFTALIQMGLTPKDLLRRVENKTILEHLQAGAAMDWLAQHPDIQRMTARRAG
jgi:hypothetical protein